MQFDDLSLSPGGVRLQAGYVFGDPREGPVLGPAFITVNIALNSPPERLSTLGTTVAPIVIFVVLTAFCRMVLFRPVLSASARGQDPEQIQAKVDETYEEARHWRTRIW